MEECVLSNLLRSVLPLRPEPNTKKNGDPLILGLFFKGKTSLNFNKDGANNFNTHQMYWDCTFDGN